MCCDGVTHSRQTPELVDIVIWPAGCSFNLICLLKYSTCRNSWKHIYTTNNNYSNSRECLLLSIISSYFVNICHQEENEAKHLNINDNFLFLVVRPSVALTFTSRSEPLDERTFFLLQ